MKDAIYFIAPTRGGGWRVRKVVEHGPYHDRRPTTWRGPYATSSVAQLAAYIAEQPRATAAQPEQATTTGTNWMERIFVVTPEMQARMDREGWCISQSDRYGWWQVERDDEQSLLADDEAAYPLAQAAGVPVGDDGRLLKYPVHYRSLQEEE